MNLLINYILPVVMPTLRKFCNLDCLAILHLYIWQVDTGYVCKFVRFNITLQCSKRWSTEKSIIWLINIHMCSYVTAVIILPWTPKICLECSLYCNQSQARSLHHRNHRQRTVSRLSRNKLFSFCFNIQFSFFACKQLLFLPIYLQCVL